MKTSYSISPDIIIAIAQMIGQCDFRTTVSLYTTSPNYPWIITVGESGWCRHLIVESVLIGNDGLAANLAVLSQSESDKFGDNVRTTEVAERIELKDLIADSYIGVKKVLYPRTLTAQAPSR